MTLQSFAQLLQFSISPIALISGASLLLLSITNRLGRTIDRSRILVRELESGVANVFRQDHVSQLEILQKRSGYLRLAVLCISTSIFFSALMMLGIVVTVFGLWDVKVMILLLLFAGVLSLCAAVVYLVLDVSAGLKALELEVQRQLRKG